MSKLREYRLWQVWNLSVLEGSIRPVLATGLDVDRFLVWKWIPIGSGIGCSVFDPQLKIGDHLIGQLSFGRHLQGIVFQSLHQQTVVDLIRNDRRTAFTST